MLIMVNLFFFVNLKDKIYLYYVFLTFSTNFTLAYHEGLLQPLVKNVFFKYDVDIISHFALLVASFLFFRTFVKLSFHFKKIDTILKYTIVFIAIIYLGYFINLNHIWLAYADIMVVTFFLFLWVLAFFFFKKEPHSKLYTLAFGAVVFATFIHITFSGIGNIPFFGHTTNIVKTGLIIEAIILTYATTYRTRKIKEENLKINLDLQNYINQVLSLENSLKVLSKNDVKLNAEKVNAKVYSEAKKYNLTARETDVLIYLTKGVDNKQIATELFISRNTLKYHTRNIYEKLDINKRTDITSKLLFDS